MHYLKACCFYIAFYTLIGGFYGVIAGAWMILEKESEAPVMLLCLPVYCGPLSRSVMGGWLLGRVSVPGASSSTREEVVRNCVTYPPTIPAKLVRVTSLEFDEQPRATQIKSRRPNPSESAVLATFQRRQHHLLQPK
ncbi:hypothetical protein BV898_07101 [Hypsibius exemplaris]|uniref:Uncharacterized protein n=1 Tax=Hypsibius exemplaris TaxID=2072580 RepID=A0A1W0WUG5_HYPEX|nr:hypothetical protein BV898_07101 [Hypsibius exemplaris]